MRLYSGYTIINRGKDTPNLKEVLSDGKDKQGKSEDG